MRIAIGLGSSLGDRRRTLETTVLRLATRRGLTLLRTSSWVRTPPLRGGTARNWFLNGVALFESSIEPLVLLDLCVALEEAAGRRRAHHWGDRTLDLDLLLAGDRVIDTERLKVPHPAIARRPFVLGPLLEVWPDARDPVTGRPFAECPPPAGPRPVPIGRLAPRSALRYL